QRFAPGAAVEQGARNIHHLRRMLAHIKDRRSTVPAEAARIAGGLVREMADGPLALGHAEAASPAPHIGRVRRAVGPPAAARMVVPGPAGGNPDRDMDLAAQAVASNDPFLRSRFDHGSTTRLRCQWSLMILDTQIALRLGPPQDDGSAEI